MAVSLCEAAEALSLKSVDDDTTVMVCKICEKSTANILIGPPQNPGNDLGVLRSFFEAEGRHIVCGGTTSKMAAAYLGAAVKPLADTATEKVPAMSRIDGVDLVTEGYLTLSETVRIAEGFVSSDPRVIPLNNDGASLMCNMLFEQANEVNIFFGTAENAENAALHADLGSKLLLINKLADLLRQQGKNVKINMC
jgi:hypothetical protein